ncbi:D-alanyl-D-alanine carboxypeptidase family protein [Vreelandella neptunia]|uniref:D-alanyl-D-alanine carboxypeptidase family protein n=1 Tax=Vreelandella neptunia TaxID=115551 RepID=A0ABZ0YNM5_9GAMM|nr:D-alanyl-D-alanine carboxypeptidase family protein [Halomonas neptunia]MDN3560773.1 D-alanyl-D-alanine carboxypeptidase family protein [Halomonas neptunia]WQH13084.1 D-alanyl-D-alanine carboxypeptidase family protein [Halomonas neptunia]
MLMLLILATVTTAHADNPRYAGIVVDLDNGEVLYAENIDDQRYPASLTKMMTLYLTFEALEEGTLRLDQPLPVSSYAAAKPAVKLWLAAGSSIPVDTAIRALAVRSANDVAAVVAEALGGSEAHFAQMMTTKARELGMHATTFRNASGLPDAGQITTARDMLTLSVRVMQDFPQYYHYFGLQEFSYRGTRHTSHNRLVRDYPGADGLKTGFIRASGFNVATTAVRGDRRLVGVVMGGFSSQSRDTHMANLLDRSFLRASLRDQQSWMGDTSFSREFMAFEPPAQPVAPQQPAPQQPLLAVVETTSPSANATPSTPLVDLDEQLADIATIQRPPPESEAPQPDPLQAFIERERQLASANETGGGWGVQVGAFSREAQARQLAQQAAQRIAQSLGGRIAVDTVEGQSPVYRARLMALDEQRARQACRELHSQGMDCMVVNASL